MPIVILATCIFGLAFAVPYVAPRLGLAAGLVALAVALPMTTAASPIHLDFGAERPLGVALALHALVWIAIAAARMSRPTVVA